MQAEAGCDRQQQEGVEEVLGEGMSMDRPNAFVTAYHDRVKAGVSFGGFVSGLEILSPHRTQPLIDEVHYQIAVAVAQAVMLKLGPAIDKAVQEAFVDASKKVAQILENFYLDVGRVGMITEGTGIDHAHIKLFPMHGTEHLKKGEWRQNGSNQEFWFEKYEGWICSGGGPMADMKKLAELSRKIKQS